METGDRLGDFEVLIPHSAGGMGEVYLAEDIRTGERVALKVLPPRFRKNEYLLGRFRAEADMYRKLAHPNIVRYVASGVEREIPFVALEFIKGTTLAARLDSETRIPAEAALSLMLDITYALNFAHQKRIIHRDIKPQNVMLTREGVVKLIDFGVAQAEQEHVRTSAGSVIGSICYNSPEQNQGLSVDERSDVYSLGLLFYEVLTGERVLASRPIAEIVLAQAELDQKLVPPSRREVVLPEELDRLVVRMLRFEAERRPQSMEEVLAVLQPLAQGGLRKLGAEARAAKVSADRDLADTHYWKAMNALAEGRYLPALDEFEQILSVSLFDNSDFRRRVEEQLDFVAWRLNATREDAASTPALGPAAPGADTGELAALQMDVLQKLHRMYSIKPHDGIKAAMAGLLSFYRDRMRDDPRGGKAPKAPLSVGEADYARILNRLAQLYERIGSREQKKLVQRKLVQHLGRVRDPALAERLWAGVAKAGAQEPVLLEGYADYLARRGEAGPARRVRVELAHELERRDEHARAVLVWQGLLEKEPDDAELAESLTRARMGLEAASRRTEELIALLQTLETAQDRGAAINLCRRFLGDHPADLRVLERLADLQRGLAPPAELAQTMVELGKAHYDKGGAASARDYFAEALMIDPDHGEAIQYLVEIMAVEDPSLTERASPKEIRRELYVRLGMAEPAVRDLKAKLKGGPRDAELLLRIEEIHRRCGDVTAAATAARDRLACLLDLGDPPRARAQAEQFLSRYPEHRSLLLELHDHPGLSALPDLVAELGGG